MSTTFAQRAMNSRMLAGVYENVWRPFAFYVASGVTTAAEQRRAADVLDLSGRRALLDVACGPGNFTGRLAPHLADDGLAVGFDLSVPMLRRAVADNSGPRTAYVRGDARRLPFADRAFDAVCCFGALYLMPDPFDVAREMIRVLSPGGRIAILTSYAGAPAAVRPAMTVGAAAIGLRLFERDDFVDLFSSAGLVDIEQQTQRALQFVSAAKPCAG